MEQDPGDKGLGQDEAWAEAAAKVRASGAVVRGAVSEPVRGVPAFAPIAVRKWCINGESPATIRHAPNAVPP